MARRVSAPWAPGVDDHWHEVTIVTLSADGAQTITRHMMGWSREVSKWLSQQAYDMFPDVKP